MFDLHFHSKASDGKKPKEEQFELAKKLGLKCAVLTDHDVISDPSDLARYDIDSFAGSEISAQYTRPDDSRHYLHLTAYSRHFNQSLGGILHKSLIGKMAKIRAQIMKLAENEMPVNYDEFIAACSNRGYNPKNLNNAHLAKYLWGKRHEARVALGKYTSPRDIMHDCLYESGGNPIGAVEAPEYTPSVEDVAQAVVPMSRGILSVAHPNFSWGKIGGIVGFQKDIGTLVEKGINGIELNALANPEWTRIILETKNKYGLILTFGSDNHGRDEADPTHGVLGQMNPYFLENPKRMTQAMRDIENRLEK